MFLSLIGLTRNNMKNILLKSFYLILLFVFSSHTNFNVGEKYSIKPESLKEHIQHLASDELEGRFTGSNGNILAADYILDNFKDAGLLPLFDKSYTQSTTIISGVDYGSNNNFSAQLGDEKVEIVTYHQYLVLPFSDNISYSGEVVFAGYGISATDKNYNNYENIDVTDKAVLIFKGTPDSDNPHSELTRFSSARAKVSTAKEKGVKLVIFISDNEENIKSVRYDYGGISKEIGILEVNKKTADKFLIQNNTSVKEISDKIQNDKVASSFLINNSSIKVSIELELQNAEVINVGGIIEGSDDKLKNEYIVVGAHFDHLGWGQTGSLYRGEETLIHYGADDNASGTAGLIELANYFSANKNLLKRSLVFVGFSGEELGLIGSNYFVNNSPIPIENIVTMINMDMIGRMNEENNLMVYGTGTSDSWNDLLNEFNNKYNFNLTFHKEGFGPSDHSSFYAKEIPVLFYFTGTHTDYHRPSDTWDKIEYEKLSNVLYYVSDMITHLSNVNERPNYINIPRQNTQGMTSFKVTLGIIPDYAFQGEGLKITGSNQGSPSYKAGMKNGDIIIKMGEKKIGNIYDYMGALNSFSPGDTTTVVVLREGNEIELSVSFIN